MKAPRTLKEVDLPGRIRAAGGTSLKEAGEFFGWEPAYVTKTAADFTKGLDMVANETLGGFAPALTFTAGKGHPVDCWYTARVVGGVPQQVGGQLCHAAA